MPAYVFDKLDGNNIRAEWSPKKGFWKFGTKTHLIDETDPYGKLAIPLIKAQESALHDILKPLRLEKAVLFFELFGPSTFVGIHNYEESGFKAVLIDISVHKKGFLMPAEFVKMFSDKIETPELVYRGTVNQTLVDAVKAGTLAGVTFEGVVCKGAPLKNGYPPHMFKIKSNAWIDKVKSLYSDPKVLEALL